MRRVKFQIGEYYHIFNRGIEKREVFCEQKDFIRFIRGMREFNTIEVIGSLYEKEYRDKRDNANKDIKDFEPLVGGSVIKRPGLQLETGSHDGSCEEKGDTKKLVEIICYCLIPNHFHFI